MLPWSITMSASKLLCPICASTPQVPSCQWRRRRRRWMGRWPWTDGVEPSSSPRSTSSRTMSSRPPSSNSPPSALCVGSLSGEPPVSCHLWPCSWTTVASFGGVRLLSLETTITINVIVIPTGVYAHGNTQFISNILCLFFFFFTGDSINKDTSADVSASLSKHTPWIHSKQHLEMLALIIL